MTKTSERKMNSTRRIPGEAVPILIFASVLSIASLGWTTYSLLDLLSAGLIGVTVAATADIIWSAVIWCEYKGIGPKVWVKAIGWIAVAIVGAFISWHGIAKDSAAMAVAGPFLTVGTKAVWELALIALKDPVKEVTAKSEKDIALLNAETDTILKRAEAEIRQEDARSEAGHKRALAEKQRQHELEMADLTNKAEKDKAATAHRADLLAGSLENSQMERVIGLIERLHSNQAETIQGEVVAPPKPSALPQAAKSGTGRMVTVSIGAHDTPLTPAQENRRRLAALYYLFQDDHASQGLALSYSAFAAMIDENKMQVTRSVREFPRDTIGDIETYRSHMRDVLKDAG